MSWGRYPAYSQTAFLSSWRDDLAADVSHLVREHGSTLAFGKGRSYGDSCLARSDHVIQTTLLNRFISVDWGTGVIVAESGVTLEDIINIAIPNGWFLPVTPGTKYVTLGGAIANDVHGKNHHVRGTFGCHVKQFGLLRTDGSTIVCSPVKNKDFFEATIGGLGLTGIIEWVALQLMPVHSSNIVTTKIRFNSLNEFVELSNELDHKHEYSVAWIDCLATGNSLGRGVFIVGDHAHDEIFELRNNKRISVPIIPSVSVINRFSLYLLNNMYYRSHKPGRHAGIDNYDPFFYPLDQINNWNRAYGSKGFQQYQCVLPNVNSEEAARELLIAISKTGNGSFLAVLKRCGDIVSPGLLSFPIPGISLALDFPQSDGLISGLFSSLDKIVLESGGRLYPAKDAHMKAKDFRMFYSNWEKLDLLRDPGLNSRFWDRVTSI